MCWPVRLLRGLRPDRNQLRRASDRAEAAIATGLMAAFLASAPFAAMTAAHWSHAANAREARAQQAAWHKVPAVLLARAPQDQFVAYGPATTTSVRAWWTAPDGSRHSGYVNALPGTRPGTTVSTWTDASGQPTGPPLRAAQVADRTALAAMLAPMATAVVFLAAWWLARRALTRRRLAAWDADWSATGPRWTSLRLQSVTTHPTHRTGL